MAARAQAQAQSQDKQLELGLPVVQHAAVHSKAELRIRAEQSLQQPQGELASFQPAPAAEVSLLSLSERADECTVGEGPEGVPGPSACVSSGDE